MEKGELNNSAALLSLIMDQKIKNLYKFFLSQLEALKVEHDSFLKEVSLKNGGDFSGYINYLNKEKFSNIRKMVLDSGNDCVRETQALISCYDLEFNEKECRKNFETKKTFKSTNYLLYKI